MVLIASILCKVALAEVSDLKPRIGLINFFNAAWSLSILLFSHLQLICRIPSPGSSMRFFSPVTRA